MKFVCNHFSQAIQELLSIKLAIRFVNYLYNTFIYFHTNNGGGSMHKEKIYLA